MKTSRDFRDFALYPKSKTRISRKIFFTSNFERSGSLDEKTTKPLIRQKLKDQGIFWLEKVKIFEVSEFSILPYTQNRKLGNLGKCCFTSNFEIYCNFTFRNDKNGLIQKFKGQDMVLEEKTFFSEFSGFSILLYTRNWKSRKVFFYFKFW